MTNLGAIGALYNPTMDPAYDDVLPGRYAGEDNGLVLALISPVIKYPSIKQFPGGASTDLTPDRQHPENPLPLLKDQQ